MSGYCDLADEERLATAALIRHHKLRHRYERRFGPGSAAAIRRLHDRGADLTTVHRLTLDLLDEAWHRWSARLDIYLPGTIDPQYMLTREAHAQGEAEWAIAMERLVASWANLGWGAW